MTTKTLKLFAMLALIGLVIGPGGGWRAYNMDKAAILLATPGLVAKAQAMGPPSGRGGGGDGGSGGGGSNTAPVAHAGFDQSVAVGDTVVLNGTRSTDADGDEVTQSWTITFKPGGSIADLSDATVMRPTFVADLAGEYVIKLTVNDGTDDSTADSVTISTNNSAPVADAGIDREITQDTTVELDGTASSDVDGDEITYAWTLTAKPSGSSAALSSSTSPRPTFTADTAGDYVFELIVNDGAAASEPASVTLSTGNIPPVADAGTPKTKPVLEAIILDSINSYDGNGDQISHMWSVLSSPAPDTLAIGDTGKIRSGISYSATGDYVIQLIVDDGSGPSVPKTVLITTGNTVPIADAGPDQSITAGTEVSLDGAGSTDDDGDEITYAWALIHRPAGSNAAIIDASAVRPGFTADMEGSYIAQLMVDDGTTTSRPSTVVISTSNVAPVADAGPDQTSGRKLVKLSPSRVQLLGGGSYDADGDTLGFNWALIFKPDKSDATLPDPNTVNPGFTVDKTGQYIAQLIVNDGTSVSAPDTIFISVPGRKAIDDDSDVRPVAGGGPDQFANVGQVIEFNGTFSFDTQDDVVLTYRWSLIHKPAGSEAQLSFTSAVRPTITPDVPGTYVVQLIVRDTRMDSLPATVVVVVVATVQLFAP